MHLKTRAILGVATVGAAIGAALVPATNAVAATPTLTVTMNEPTGLNQQSGDTVTAVGSGYTPGATIALVQCSSVKLDGSGCDQQPADARITAADSNGAFTVNDLVVTTGVKGTDGVSCNAGSTCFVAGANVANTAEAAADDFVFDNLQVTPRTGIKNGTVLHLVGANYGPGKTIYVSECNSTDKATALQHCDSGGAVKTFTAGQDGTFTADYAVTIPIHASSAGTYSCVAGGSCVVAATDSLANPGSGNIGGALVNFAALAKTVTKATGPSSVAKGAKFAIKSTVTAAGKGVAGLKVTLYKVKSSGLTKIASGKTGSTGKHKFGGLKQKKTTKYKVKTTANSSYAASVSKVLKVKT